MASQRSRTSGSGGRDRRDRRNRSAGFVQGATGAGGPRADLASVRERLTGIVQPAVTSAGYELDGLSVNRMGRRHLVRVTVDGDNGVDSGAIAALAQRISTALDEAEQSGGDIVAGQYTLEVSSPGVDRPLTAPRHWRRNLGRLVKVKLGDRVVTGRIVGADDEGVSLDADGTLIRAGHDELGPGRVEIEFNRPGGDAPDLGDMDDGDVDADPADGLDDEELDDDEDEEGVTRSEH